MFLNQEMRGVVSFDGSIRGRKPCDRHITRSDTSFPAWASP